MKMRSHEIIPIEEAKRPQLCHPDLGNNATPILSSRPRKQSDPHPVPVGSRSKLSDR